MNDITIPEARSIQYFFKRQGWHLLSLALLVAVAYAFASPAMGDGSWLGIPDIAWFWTAIALVILHQVLVWIVFRLQLGWAALSKLFGKADLTIWSIAFLPLLIARPILVIGLAMTDRGSLALPRCVEITLGVMLLLPALYALWSVGRYFGLERALGGDHFRQKYRDMPMVHEGAFQWSSNAMYAFVFLGLWAIALLLDSQAALSLALFQHAYIWVHFWCTEEPDMKLMRDIRIRMRLDE